jgi:hypothetical protein
VTIIIPNEYQECIAFYQWCQTKPVVQDLIIKICNEGIRTPKQAMGLRAIGMRPGIPDYLLPLANGTYHSLWIEMKRRDKVKTKKEPRQEYWLAKLHMLGHYSTYAYGWEDAARIVEQYISNTL